MGREKPLEFRGDSYSELLAFPRAVLRQAGYELSLVQHGSEPSDWKPMRSIGAGVNELRIRDSDGAFRVIYVAKFAEAIFVLHCFQKKSQKTPAHNLERAEARYRELIEELRRGQREI